jgi:hypothetical protein
VLAVTAIGFKVGNGGTRGVCVCVVGAGVGAADASTWWCTWARLFTKRQIAKRMMKATNISMNCKNIVIGLRWRVFSLLYRQRVELNRIFDRFEVGDSESRSSIGSESTRIESFNMF